MVDKVATTPSTASVLADGVVIMANTDLTGVHTFTSGTVDGFAPNPDGVFDTGVLMSGETRSFSFSQPGNYPYYCMLHTWMTGTLVVSDVKVDSVGGEMSITLSPDRTSYENGNKVNITGKILNYNYATISWEMTSHLH